MSQIVNTLDSDDEYVAPRTPCTYLCGNAGVGKSTELKRRVLSDPSYAILCASSGVASVNLGTTTINSLLKYFDTASLYDKFVSGRLTSTLHEIGRRFRNIAIDEASMLGSTQLDYIFRALEECNDFPDMQDKPLGLILCGDLGQLPPVEDKPICEADSWIHFSRNIEKLTKVWRQSDTKFLQALDLARVGDGQGCVDILQSLGVQVNNQISKNFPGTTLISKNLQVDNYNYGKLLDLPGKPFGLKSQYWGEESPEWRKNIPDVLKLKIGSYVLILANDTLNWEYANGSCGWIRSLDGTSVVIELVTGANVRITPIYRTNATHELMEPPVDVPHLYCSRDCDSGSRLNYVPWGRVTYNCSSGTYNVGGVRYYPLRQADAISYHRSQSLTLDRVQICFRDQFSGYPSMSYVALTRVRSPQGLRLVATNWQQIIKRIKVDERLKKWM